MTKQEAKKAREAVRAKQRDDDLRAVLSTFEGRRVFAALLDDLHGGIFGERENDSMQRAAALHDKATLLERTFARVAPDAYRLLKSEQLSEHLLDTQLREIEG